MLIEGCRWSRLLIHSSTDSLGRASLSRLGARASCHPWHFLLLMQQRTERTGALVHGRARDWSVIWHRSTHCSARDAGESIQSSIQAIFPFLLNADFAFFLPHVAFCEDASSCNILHEVGKRYPSSLQAGEGQGNHAPCQPALSKPTSTCLLVGHLSFCF